MIKAVILKSIQLVIVDKKTKLFKRLNPLLQFTKIYSSDISVVQTDIINN
jgi:hypothetical protein